MAAQENNPGEDKREQNNMNNSSDVGGSQTKNPLAEDIEIEVYATYSIYCIKYILWRRF